MSRRILLPLIVLLALAAAPPAALAEGPAKKPGKNLREAIFVGNNWEGTADVIRPTKKGRRYTTVARLNIHPDLQERMLEIYPDPVRLGYFLAIPELVGEGNDQFVDDMFSTHDGRMLIVSRPSLRDVVAINIASGEIVWRFVVE